MLYPKNESDRLKDSLFRSPTSEYRGTPFWAWNTHPDKEELCRQIEIFRQMGFGGFHMHVRSGMDQPYLSRDFFDCIRTCVEEAKKKNMLAWLYDEDRWPSGSAGGMLTKDPSNRQHFLLFTCTPYCGKTYRYPQTASGSSWAERTENGVLLARYAVDLDRDGCLKSYRRLADEEASDQKIWYAYVESPSPNPWYNGQTYADLLNPDVTRLFLQTTHEAYKRELGGSFDTSVTPAIFTDEPQTARKRPLPEAVAEDAEAVFPWSPGMEADFLSETGIDVLDRLPELFWDLPESRPSSLRWQFHDWLAERFAASFADVYGEWCDKNGLPLTGHVMREPSLTSQTESTGETMRSYRSFTIPGIDMLHNKYEYTTAKQAQSAVRQYGREAMTSELYGCTGWNYDFAGYKRQGDWQAALGVTVRVPHLSFLSMRGEAKRDYPASIGYQSPWWKEFANVEDHFARLATALSRGKSTCRVAVIHPVESFWLAFGPQKESAARKTKLDSEFLTLTEWLLFGSIDFDFISEALLPSLCPSAGAPLRIGEMSYDAVIVPPVLTLRESTLQRLLDFRRAGGKLIFVGDSVPSLVNAVPSDAVFPLYRESVAVPFERRAILAELEELREIDIHEIGNPDANELLFNLLRDRDCKWLFLAQGRQERYEGAKIFCVTLNGLFTIEKYDTANGTHKPFSVICANGKTIFTIAMHDCDSLLLCLHEVEERTTLLNGKFAYSTDDPNVLLLDSAEYALDGEAYHARTELLRADNLCRQRLGFAPRESAFVQPWVHGKETMRHRIALRFTIQSEIEGILPELAGELTADSRVRFNGCEISVEPNGYYVDRAIVKLPLTALQKGENVLEVELPFGETSNTEWFYLLGDFGVRLEGNCASLTAKPTHLTVGDLAEQGYPFYSGKISYHIDLESHGGETSVALPSFGGTFVRVTVNGVDRGIIAYPPHTLSLGCLGCGTHRLTLELCIPRTNAFGPVHFVEGADSYLTPNTYRTKGDDWVDSYVLAKQGILSPVRITERLP